MHAIILSIGDELVLGQTIDTNSAYLSARLAELGITTRSHQTLADDLPTITQAIREAAAQAQLVLISGGLGPTDDDLTRAALAQAMGVALVEHPASLERIAAFFARRQRTMSPRNRCQALHPLGSQPIDNDHGTAPGIKAHLGQATLYVTPGVPSELFAMFDEQILPELRQLAGGRQVILTTRLNTFGIGESDVAQTLGDLMRRDRNPKVGTTVSDGIVGVRVRSEFPTPQEACEHLEQTCHHVHDALGALIYGRDQQTLQDDVIGLLKARRQRLCTIESCTGGQIGALLTEVPGASSVYQGGWITYANAMKTQQVQVEPCLLETHGAVSPQVACAMAIGGLEQSATDWALAVTGIAGPGGGTQAKPVGTVWIALASTTKDGSPQAQATRFLFAGDRQTIRDRAAKTALQLLRLRLRQVDPACMSWIVETWTPPIRPAG